MSKQTIKGGGAFTAKNISDLNANFTELYAGGSGQTLASPAITGTVTGGASYTAPTLTTPVLTAGTVTTSLVPTTNDGAPLGDTTHQFSDLFLAEGGVINFDNGDATITQAGDVVTVGGAALANSSPGTAANSVATIDGTQTLTNKTITGAIDTDFKVLAGTATYTSTITPATLTGFSWTVVPGTYVFQVNLPATMTTVGGLTINFLLTTAVLTSIQYQSYAATAADATTSVSTQGTTTTSGTKVFDSKTAAYTLVSIMGSMVVGTGGSFAWQGCQNTSAGGGDASAVLLGAYARLTRIA